MWLNKVQLETSRCIKSCATKLMPQSSHHLDSASALLALHAARGKQHDPERAAPAAGTSGAAAQEAAGPSDQASALPIQLSAMRKADVSDFKGTVYVNIREYYEVSALAR